VCALQTAGGRLAVQHLIHVGGKERGVRCLLRAAQEAKVSRISSPGITNEGPVAGGKTR